MGSPARSTASSSTAAASVRSHEWIVTSDAPATTRRAAASARTSLRRPTRCSRGASAHSLSAIAYPIPVPPPVTTILRLMGPPRVDGRHYRDRPGRGVSERTGDRAQRSRRRRAKPAAAAGASRRGRGTRTGPPGRPRPRRRRSATRASSQRSQPPRTTAYGRTRDTVSYSRPLGSWSVGLVSRSMASTRSPPSSAVPLAVRAGISCATNIRPRAGASSARPSRPNVVNATSSSRMTAAIPTTTQATRDQKARTLSGRDENQPRETTSSYRSDCTEAIAGTTPAASSETLTEPPLGAIATSSRSSNGARSSPPARRVSVQSVKPCCAGSWVIRTWPRTDRSRIVPTMSSGSACSSARVPT